MEKNQTYYIDANIFVYSIINNEKLGNKCRDLLRDIQAGKINCITSCLTYDEIIWVLKKISPDKIIEASTNFLNLNIKFAEVNKIILQKTQDILEKYNLRPRDAIHLATMMTYNCHKIISDDSDFDKIKEIKRINIFNLQIETEYK